MTEEEMYEATFELVKKLASSCHEQDSSVVLAAMASVAGQAVYIVALSKQIPPLKVIEAYAEDIKVWTAKYIEFHISENFLAPAEKAATNPTEH
jgi:hypothetical protein